MESYHILLPTSIIKYKIPMYLLVNILDNRIQMNIIHVFKSGNNIGKRFFYGKLRKSRKSEEW